MKYFGTYLFIAGLLMINEVAFATCAEENPQGAEAVITCAAHENGFSSAEDFWNNKLFSLITLDGYCQRTPSGLTVAQAELFGLSCPNDTGTYFSYAGFIAADTR